MDFHAFQYFIAHIQTESLWLLSVGVITFVIGAYFYLLDKSKIWFYSLFFLAFTLTGIGFAIIPDYLNPWDEQFHALVAKNFMHHPFRPTLFGEIYHANYQDWSANHIWLHKQPLFLWQIAISFKLFGVSLLSLRLPSILMHAATSILILSISKRYLSKNFALLCAALFAFSDFQLGLVSGVIGMDHNDVAFCFYITASFWAWIKYYETKQLKWVIWIGFFSGGAILCKWLVGLIVYAGWGIILLLTELKVKRAWRDIMTSAIITIIIALPWQIYCYFSFTTEYLYELNYNTLHFSSGIEGHIGDYMYHLNGMNVLYGNGILVQIIIISSILLMLLIGLIKKKHYYSFASSIFIIIYLFFTLASTKLIAYPGIVMAFGFIALLFPFNYLFNLIGLSKSKKSSTIKLIVLPILILFVTFHFIKFDNLIDYYSLKDSTYFKWKNNKLNYVLEVIKKDNNPAQVYYVKDDRNLFIPISVKFKIDAKIFPYPKKGYVYSNVKVIDLEGIGEN